MNNTVRCPYIPSRSLASFVSRRMSETPAVTAFSCSKWALVLPAITLARVVFPVPGGP